MPWSIFIIIPHHWIGGGCRCNKRQACKHVNDVMAFSKTLQLTTLGSSLAHATIYYLLIWPLGLLDCHLSSTPSDSAKLLTSRLLMRHRARRCGSVKPSASPPTKHSLYLSSGQWSNTYQSRPAERRQIKPLCKATLVTATSSSSTSPNGPNKMGNTKRPFSSPPGPSPCLGWNSYRDIPQVAKAHRNCNQHNLCR